MQIAKIAFAKKLSATRSVYIQARCPVNHEKGSLSLFFTLFELGLITVHILRLFREERCLASFAKQNKTQKSTSASQSHFNTISRLTGGQTTVPNHAYYFPEGVNYFASPSLAVFCLHFSVGPSHAVPYGIIELVRRNQMTCIITLARERMFFRSKQLARLQFLPTPYYFRPMIRS